MLSLRQALADRSALAAAGRDLRYWLGARRRESYRIRLTGLKSGSAPQ
jgi:hypothetical protein